MTIFDRADHILSQDLHSQPVAQATTRRRPRTGQRRKLTSLQSFAAVAAVSCTIIVAIYMLCQYQFTQNTGVIVHATPIGSEVTIEDQIGTVIKTGVINSLGELQLNGMRPGVYQLSVSHIGFSTATKSLKLIPNKMVAIGIPESLELAAETNETGVNGASNSDSSNKPNSNLSSDDSQQVTGKNESATPEPEQVQVSSTENSLNTSNTVLDQPAKASEPPPPPTPASPDPTQQNSLQQASLQSPPNPPQYQNQYQYMYSPAAQNWRRRFAARRLDGSFHGRFNFDNNSGEPIGSQPSLPPR